MPNLPKVIHFTRDGVRPICANKTRRVLTRNPFEVECQTCKKQIKKQSYPRLAATR